MDVAAFTSWSTLNFLPFNSFEQLARKDQNWFMKNGFSFKDAGLHMVRQAMQTLRKIGGQSLDHLPNSPDSHPAISGLFQRSKKNWKERILARARNGLQHVFQKLVHRWKLCIKDHCEDRYFEKETHVKSPSDSDSE